MTLVTFYTPVKAFTINVIRNIEEIVEDIFVVHKKVSFSDNNQDDKNKDIKSDDPRIDDARSKVAFEVLSPNYIPKHYELYMVDVFNKDKEMEQVSLLYINTEDDENKEAFEIVMQSLPMGSESQMNYILEPDTKIDHIELEGIEYTLVTHNKMYNILIWDIANLSYKIDGNISREDIIKIAQSME